MTPARWARLRELFEAAREKPEDERDAFLDEACRSDPELRQELKELLAEERESDIHSPIAAFLRPAARPILSADSMLGRYRVERELGAGGMGIVYRAYDTELRRRVALKVLPAEFSLIPERRERLLREARAASALSHPNIVGIYEVGSVAGMDFIAMELIEGQSLDGLIPAGGLPLETALDYAVQIAGGLAKAHGCGVIHRDLKPRNIMATETSGHTAVVKLLDFGLAKQVSVTGVPENYPGIPTNPTAEGEILGTPRYMSPEQAAGKALDVRTDIFSFGALLYEMLTGVAAFQRDSTIATLAAVLRDDPAPVESLRADVPSDLRRILRRCLEKERDARYPSGADLCQDLMACRARLAERNVGWRSLLRPRFVAAAAVLAVALLLAGTWLAIHEARVRWARNVALPETARLIAAGQFDDAFRLVGQAERYVPDDAEMRRLKGECSTPAKVETVPPGAHVFWKSYRLPGAAWEPLGQSPVKDALVPRRYLRWRIVKPGFEPVEVAGFGPGPLAVTLTPVGEKPGMVRIPPGVFLVPVPNRSVALGEFWLDTREVANREYQLFIDRGGYENRQYWKQPFVENGKTLSWEEAMARFRDTTGRPGPSSWEMSAFPEGKEDFPVSGVSWYEAAAYAEFAGKELPTIYHWRRAAIGTNYEVMEFSNFAGRGPVKTGSLPGLSPFGNYDMAGNVKEWCWNETTGGRYLLGGAWNDPSYAFADWDAQSPFARSDTYGFRCAKYSSPVAPALRGAFTAMRRDYNREKPVSDEVYRAYQSLYAYDHTELNPVVEAKDDGSPYWRREKITIDAAYNNERVPVHLFLPRNAQPPYQAVIFFPGSNAYLEKGPSDRLSPAEGGTRTDYLVRSGRALVYPICARMYERERNRQVAFQIPAATSLAWRDLIVAAAKDLARTIDYLETRPDIDKTRIAYYGASVGGVWGPIFTAVDARYKAAVFLLGALPYEPYAPEVDPLNFARRSHVPVLLLNGRYDFTFPLDGSQRPLLRLLGAPEKEKRLVLFETAHNLPAAPMMKEALAWLDHYLGPVPVH
jgi:dienelactone hydrolase